LIDAKYAGVCTECSKCGDDIQAEPVGQAHGSGKKLYWRCMNWECQHRHPVTHFTPWPKTKLRPSQLVRAVREYSNYDRLVPPEVDDIAKAAGAGRSQIAPIVAFLCEREGAQAKVENATGTIQGDLEIDGHEVAKLYISPNNEHYRHLLPKNHATKPQKYYQLFVRVAGLRTRGRGKLYLRLLKNHVLVPPKSRPPPESIEELLDADLLRHAGKGSMVHPDGAPAYKAVMKHPRYKSKKLRMPKTPVSHKENEYTKPVPKKVGFSSLTGTQCIDRVWKELDRAIPATLHRKRDHVLNPEIMDRVWAWLHRYNAAPVDDGFEHLGSLVSWSGAKHN
jgi:hypothetical protein